MLNLVTGLFVDGAQKLHKRDTEAALTNQLRRLFEDYDSDEEEAEAMTWERFSHLLDRPEMVSFFSALNLTTGEAETVFSLLDRHGSGTLTADDFVKGGLNLQGPAKAIDLAKMFHFTTVFSREIAGRVTSIQQAVDTISEHTVAVQEHLARTVKHVKASCAQSSPQQSMYQNDFSERNSRSPFVRPFTSNGNNSQRAALQVPVTRVLPPTGPPETDPLPPKFTPNPLMSLTSAGCRAFGNESHAFEDEV